jgi:hypothetical protein
MNWAARPWSERPLEVDDVQGIASSKSKGRANARPLQDSETIARTDDDEILESLVDTFPASDASAWVALARVGVPKREPTSRRARKPPHL